MPELPEKCISSGTAVWLLQLISCGNRTLILLTFWFFRIFFLLLILFLFLVYEQLISYSSLMAALIENLVFMAIWWSLLKGDKYLFSIGCETKRQLY